MRLRWWLSIGLFMVLVAVPGVALAATQSYTLSYTFQSHGAFVAALRKQTTVLDPQVFVADPSAPAGTGPENIAHLAGFRPAAPGRDPASAPLYSAQGKPLGFTLGTWLGAAGQGTIVCNGNRAQVTNDFRGLIPGGLYQLVWLQITTAGYQRAPLGNPNGSDSIFAAGAAGNAHVVNALGFCPNPSDGIEIAYHSDGQSHGSALGTIGVDLQSQLAARFSTAAPPPPPMPVPAAAATLPASGGVPIVVVLAVAGLALLAGLGLGALAAGGD